MRPVIFGTLFIVILVNWLWPLPFSLPVKLAIAAAIIIVSLFHQWCRLSSGSVFTPEMPRSVIIVFNWAFGTLMFLTVFQLAVDIVALSGALLFWHPIRIGIPVRIAIGAAAAILSVFGVINAVRVPPIRDVIVTIAGLPPSFDGYRIIQLTDLHITRLFPKYWTERVVSRTNQVGADLVVITGDFIDGSVAMRRDDVAPLASLRAPDGILAIPGNHEYFFDYGDWMVHLRSLGIVMLLNQNLVLARGQNKLVIAGVTDRSAIHHAEDGPDLEKALAGRPGNAPVILLDHQPGDARTAATHGVALQLSGHTHGGMVYGLDYLVARGNGGYVSGRYQLGAMTLYVSNGTGIWPGFALRLGRGSEITCFQLKAGS